MIPIFQKLSFLYQPYLLFILSLGYNLAELGRSLIGTSSKATAIDLHYGDISCQLNTTEFDTHILPVQCDEANSSEVCLSLEYNGTNYCEWNYNGLGIDYQLLAGPSFFAIYTIAGLFIGYAADRSNRVRLLSICTLVFSIAIFFMGSVQHYWHLVLLRMLLAIGEAGCNPLATGILSDIFTEEQRGLVMSIFNWGIYGGYGIAFPIGRYIPDLNIWDLGWRIMYYGTGIVGVIFAILTGFTLKEPARVDTVTVTKHSDEDAKAKKHKILAVVTDPKLILLCLAASVRHCGGLCLGYNCDLYFREYFPEYDMGWWLFAVTIGVGGIGVIFGGIVSDKFVGKMGVRSRVACLAISQLIATPFAFGSVAFEPFWAMIHLSISYFFAEMWFGILFAILVEVVPLKVRSTTVSIFLFVMNNIGSNLPILVDPVSKVIGYREALYIFYAGAYALSSLLFLLTMFLMDPPPKENNNNLKHDMGHENGICSTIDETNLHTIQNGIVATSPNGHQTPSLTNGQQTSSSNNNMNGHANNYKQHTIEMSRL